MNRRINEDTNVSYEVLNLIAPTFPKININWLIIGEGEMLKKEEARDDDDGKDDYCKNRYLESLEKIDKLRDEIDTYRDKIEELEEETDSLNDRAAQRSL